MAGEERSSLLTFPCDFPIKIMGRRSDDFAQRILAIVLRHAPDYDASSMEMRASSRGAWLSLTCVVHARSREQLDALYAELCGDAGVALVL